MDIKFVDLFAQYLSIKKDITRALSSVIAETAFISGKYAEQFEKEWAEYIGAKHCIGCANGTDSLEILLQVYGVGAGDEVIVPANTWVSTTECVVTNGATPVFVDTDPDTFTIDVTKIEEKITDKTKAIIPVHLYGMPADMDPIMEIAKKHRLIVIEDCAQAHGAEYKKKKVGTIGDAASFSFYPGKNLGAYGDAGCMMTNDPDVATKARIIANHGQQGKHNHLVSGRNSRLDGLNASILSAKLNYIEEWNKARKEIAKEYNKLFKGTKVKTPKKPRGRDHVYHIYAVMVENRDEVRKVLEERGVPTLVHYPTPQPLLPAFEHLGNKAEDYPVAVEQTSKQISLPMYPEMKPEMVEYIASTLIELVK